MRATVVVFPVPGPPATTAKRRSKRRGDREALRRVGQADAVEAGAERGGIGGGRRARRARGGPSATWHSSRQ